MKRRTKKLSIKRISFMAETLRKKYQYPCLIELTIWSWLMDRKTQINYVLYTRGSRKKYLSWDELEDAFEKLTKKEELI